MPKEADVVNALNKINPYDFEVGEDESPLLEDFFEEPIKWYDHIEDMNLIFCGRCLCGRQICHQIYM